ncbi:aminotransferase class V-fold PLP-dependent enzyme [Desulfopila inferna]|uniref:aminotransferase class V-fold PLP-dependent enzyme n=1 Tax=Desulfopila inferna TaxID=468528 RepID=UPI001966BE89|nr:aminotransferase class V-fold PLP-dependent enzyme [Desulfopila inferna]MBM9603680.1 aminotransferase class V-fold PLP-dependent enzyme [Desulfopila inferna]
MFDKSEEKFPAKRNDIFLAHCAISPIYAGAAAAMKEFVDTMANGGIKALPQYFGVIPEFHGNVGKFLRTSADNISYVHNTAEGLCMIANGYPFSPGDEVISYVHEYPSNHYPWALQKKRGVKLILLGDTDPARGYDDIERPRGWSMEELEERITPRTRIVALSHVQFTSGFAADLSSLGALCREKNIDLIVDCAQSLGVLPVFPEEFQASAVIASGWKWLMGPKGSALLYTSPELRGKLEETMAGPGLMRQGLDYLDHSWAPHGDGRMFEYSTLPWDHIVAMNVLFREIFLKYDIKEIREEVFRLQDVLLDHLDQGSLRFLRFNKENRSGILAAESAANPAETVKALAQAGVIISAPVGYLRFAPHFYNDDGQIIAAAQKVNEILVR